MSTLTQICCAHCGDPCPGARFTSHDEAFCCSGCRAVYDILRHSGLQDFYTHDRSAGTSQRGLPPGDYGWLDVEPLAARFIRYRDDSRCRVVLELPAIHCISCVWLLERLPRLLPGIISSTVDVTRRVATIDFHPNTVTLREVAEGLAAIGYPPQLRAEQPDAPPPQHRKQLYRIGVAGFCFGNIMLLSFPEYLGLGADAGAKDISPLIGYLLLFLTLPVVLYAAREFFSGAYRGVVARRITIDVPIVLGITALFGRSVYEILSATGPGYLDSLAGLVFFLLVGRWFQTYTFDRLRFDRDYHDYFPMGAYRVEADGMTRAVAVADLQAGDKVMVKPGQLIPADGHLDPLMAPGDIDYSFVTGETVAQSTGAGAAVFAGGRATRTALYVTVTRPATASYLLQLWQADDRGAEGGAVGPSDTLVRYFTVGVVLLAALTLAYHYPGNPSLGYRAATAVVIIACPCALALAAPFTYGTFQRLLGLAGYYLRSAAVIQRLARTDTYVFDKTGTLIGQDDPTPLTFFGLGSDRSLRVFRAMAGQSAHPRSLALATALKEMDLAPIEIPPVTERIGEGIQLRFQAQEYRIGSASFCGLAAITRRTYATLDGRALLALNPVGNHLRPGVDRLLESLGQEGPVHLLSGDAPPRQAFWNSYLRPHRIHFRQSPFAKKDFIDDLRAGGGRVLMVGDGLNDAGALRAADVGLAVSERDGGFSPACDGILAAERLSLLPSVLRACRRMRWVLTVSYAFALGYNLVGLSYAVTGTLSPVVAAILMPLSSITIVLLASGGSWLVYRHDIHQPGD